MAHFFIVLAALIHVYIFVMESIFWGTPNVNKVFVLSASKAKENRLFAFNQGFYNLFLAIAAVLGVALSFTQHATVAMTLMVYSCLSMFGASVVLLCSEGKMIRPALIQGIPPAAGLIFLSLHTLF